MHFVAECLLETTPLTEAASQSQDKHPETEKSQKQNHSKKLNQGPWESAGPQTPTNEQKGAVEINGVNENPRRRKSGSGDAGRLHKLDRDISKMPAKQKDVLKPTISPVLFMTVDGEPMSFYLRPGPIKQKLRPLISAGGGTLCTVQQPGAILLIDPGEKNSMTASTAHWYVSTQYIQDCIEKDEQLDLESYRLNPEVIHRHTTRHTRSSKGSSSGVSLGRTAYTPEEDAAILSYVSKRKSEVGGNRLWQEMEKQCVTGHTWQSIKYHYRVQLAKKLEEAEEVTSGTNEKGDENTSEMEGNEDTNIQKDSEGEEKDDSSQTTKEDHVQVQPEQSTTEIVEVSPLCAQKENQQEKAPNPPVDGAQPETTGAEMLTVQTNEPSAKAQTEQELIPSETPQPDAETHAPPECTQKENKIEDSTSAQSETPLTVTPSDNPKGKLKTTPKQESPKQPITQRELRLKGTSPDPEPSNKKLPSCASSSTPMNSTPTRNRHSKKTELALRASPKRSAATEQPPAKKPRANSTAETEQQPKDAVNEETTNSAPRKAKRKEKRQLGILELAAKEFDDDDESEEDEGPGVQSPSETLPTSTEAPIPTPPQSESESNIQEKLPLVTGSISANPEPPIAETSTSKAHLFIFDSETQVEPDCDDPAAPSNSPPTGDAAALCLTQTQLEEDMKAVRELMTHTDQDLDTVTKALLKTSGDLSAALNLLLNPSLVPGPFWTRRDDEGLRSANAELRKGLKEKYGEQEVAKRILFLEVEG